MHGLEATCPEEHDLGYALRIGLKTGWCTEQSLESPDWSLRFLVI